jgi:hypothetical protein
MGAPKLKSPWQVSQEFSETLSSQIPEHTQHRSNESSTVN